MQPFDQAIREHDEAVRRRGLRIWVGAEPTFTEPRSEAPEWLTEARGSELVETLGRGSKADLCLWYVDYQRGGSVPIRVLIIK